MLGFVHSSMWNDIFMEHCRRKLNWMEIANEEVAYWLPLCTLYTVHMCVYVFALFVHIFFFPLKPKIENFALLNQLNYKSWGPICPKWKSCTLYIPWPWGAINGYLHSLMVHNVNVEQNHLIATQSYKLQFFSHSNPELTYSYIHITYGSQCECEL